MRQWVHIWYLVGESWGMKCSVWHSDVYITLQVQTDYDATPNVLKWTKWCFNQKPKSPGLVQKHLTIPNKLYCYVIYIQLDVLRCLLSFRLQLFGPNPFSSRHIVTSALDFLIWFQQTFRWSMYEYLPSLKSILQTSDCMGLFLWTDSVHTPSSQSVLCPTSTSQLWVPQLKPSDPRTDQHPSNLSGLSGSCRLCPPLTLLRSSDRIRFSPAVFGSRTTGV